MFKAKQNLVIIFVLILGLSLFGQTAQALISIQTGSVTSANMRLSVANGNAFVDFTSAGTLTPYVGYKLVITDSSGTKQLVGYIKAAGTGTLGDRYSAPHQIYAIGDSLTLNGGMETQLDTLLGSNWHTNNSGVGGNTTTQMLTRFPSDVLGVGNAEYVVIWGGINDINQDRTDTFIEANLQAMYDLAYAAGLKVIAVNITPFKGNGIWTAGRQATADAVNAWIANTAIRVDYRVDAYTLLEDPGTPDTLLAAYDSNDHLHLSAAGYAAVGSAVHTAATWTPLAGVGEVLGGQVVINGDMGDTTGWTTGTQWSIGTGKASHASGAGSLNLFRAITNTPGGLYKASMDVDSATSGTVGLLLNSGGPLLILPRSNTTGTRTGYTTQTDTGATTNIGPGVNATTAVVRVDNTLIWRVLTPSATGVTITSTANGGTYNWASEDSGFNRNSATYTYAIYPGSVASTISDVNTHSYQLVDCADVSGMLGVDVTTAATLQNYTVVRCPAGAFQIEENSTLTNSIGISTTNDITVASGKTVIGTTNLFADSAKSGSGIYTDTGTLWSSDPLFVSSSDFHLQNTSPAINVGTNVGLISDYDGISLPRGIGYEIGAYEYPVPISPTISTPSAQSASAIRWNFTDNASDETGFKIYDNTDTLVTSLATPNLTYLEETGLSVNTQYSGRYAVSYNSYGNSASSSVASSVYTLANTPSTPTLTVPSSSSLNTVLSVNSNPAAINFAIYNSTLGKYLQTDGTLGNSAVWQTYSLWGGSSGTTTTGLLENTQYTYQTVAKNGDNIETTSSTDVSKYTLADVPTNLSASSNSNSVTLSVDSLPNAASGLSGYYFSRSGANSGWIQTNSWTDAGLSCGHSYDYSVIYRNGDGTETSSISTTKSTSGCGGGGMPAGWSNLPIMPIGGFKVFVNSGASTTTNRIVNLNFNAGSDVKKMAISLTGDFNDASQENYFPTKQIDLCSKFDVIKNPTCPDGTYKVYVKFYTYYGQSSGIASSTIVLKSGSTTTENLQQYTNLLFTNPFTKYLQYRQTNADIKRLQIFLNSDPDTKIAVSGAGSPGKETNYFGILTYKAVIKFQEKYAKDILVPWGFVKGTGYVGKTTLAKINELIGK